VGAALLGGCSLSVNHTLSSTSAAASISRQLATSYHIADPPVTCPTGIPVKSGQAFTCQATIDGQPLPVSGTVTDKNGDFRIATSRAVVSLSASDKRLSASLSQQLGVAVQVACDGPALVVASAGRVFDCTATGSGVSRQLRVTMTDLKGDLSVQLLPPGGTPSTTTTTG
jgi:hypothetical protein